MRGGLAIAALTLVLVAAGLGLAFGPAALEVPHPATFGGAIVAVGLAVGGPLLMRYLHTLMSSRATGGAR